MVKIHDLNESQYNTLQEMWNIDSMEELAKWKKKQPKWKRIQIQTLVHLVALAYIDDDVEKDEELKLAKQMLKKVLDL